jgi:LuxR family maltose regulon positive regulatory protein
LDARDRDPRIFVEYLIASVARRFPSFGAETRRVLQAMRSPTDGVVELVGTLVNEMVATIPEWFILVLDDFHHLAYAEPINNLLQNLIAYQPEHLHLIVASRAVPTGLPLGQLAARGEAMVLEKDDLRFAPEEVEALLQLNRYITLASEEVKDLTDMSEGWIVAILLASYSNWRGTLDIWARARDSDAPVYDYLAGEVLDRLEPGLRSFLLASSILEQMTPRLCADVLGLGNVEACFHELQRRNLFANKVPGKEVRLRYHALFRDFLQARLRQQSPDAFVALHRCAAVWFEGDGYQEGAAYHYLMSGEPQQAALMIDQAAQRLLRAGHLETLLEWMDRLPARVVQDKPRLLYHAAGAAICVGRTEQAFIWLKEAETACLSRNDELLALVLAAQALNLFTQGRWLESVQVAEGVLDFSRVGTAEMEEARVEAWRVIGACLNKLGRVEEAEAHFRTALRHAQDTGNLHRQVLIQQGLALSLLHQGRHEETLELGRATVETCRRLGSPTYLAEALNNLAYTLYSVGCHTEALDSLQEALETARRTGHRRLEAYVLISLGEVTRDLGGAQESARMISEGIEIARDSNEVDLVAIGQDVLASALLHADDISPALLAAQAAVALASRQDGGLQLDRYRATLGLMKVFAGEVAAGVEDLEAACSQLAQAGADDELARAQLFLAYARHRAGQEQEAMGHLAPALDVYLAGGTGQRLLVDSQGLRSVLERAAELGVGGRSLASVLKGARSFDREASRAFRNWQLRSAPTPPSFRAYGFDGGRVERDGRSITSSEWSTTAARYLFFHFLCQPIQTRERIVADIWPDLPPARVTGTFHTTKCRMQHALGLSPVLYEDGLYRLDGDVDIWYDVREFGCLLDRARRATEGAALRYLRKAVDLYQGDFLKGCYTDWCVQQREALRLQYLEAVRRLADGLLQRGRVGDAIPHLRRALSVDDLREDLHRHLMRAYALDGRPEVAVAQYHRCARILERDLGVPPDAETQALYDAIRAGRFPSQ